MNPTASPSSVTLELTGPLQRLVGEESIELPAGPTSRLGELLAALVERYPAAAEHLAAADRLRCDEGAIPAGFLVVRDGAAVAAQLGTPVSPGQRLTLLSVISGG